MDGQRQYPAEPDRWFGDQPDEHGHAPGQRGGERYADPDPRYGYQEYDAPPEPGYPAPPESGYPQASPGVRRRPRSARVGKRSGLELPATTGEIEPVGYGSDEDLRYGGSEGEPRYEDVSRYLPDEDAPRYRAEMIDRQALRRDDPPYAPGMEPTYQAAQPSSPVPQPSVQPAPSAVSVPTQAIPSTTPAAVYLARRSGIATLLGIAAVVIEILLVPVLTHGLLTHGLDVGAIIGGIFAMSGVPLVGLGLYGLTCGAATAYGPNPGRAWLRLPLAYLPIGLILLVAAGLAV